jgi:lipoprotein-anchoring transpeptidase ErfK/SrfK
MRNGKGGVTISKGNDHTPGCIRMKQEELDWLVENVDVSTIVVM